VAIAGDHHVMAGPLQEQPDRDLHGRIVIHDQDVGHVKNPPGRAGRFRRPQIKPSNTKLLRGFCPACKHFAIGPNFARGARTLAAAHMHVYVQMALSGTDRGRCA